jgi:hypothetical protein
MCSLTHRNNLKAFFYSPELVHSRALVHPGNDLLGSPQELHISAGSGILFHYFHETSMDDDAVVV